MLPNHSSNDSEPRHGMLTMDVEGVDEGCERGGGRDGLRGGGWMKGWGLDEGVGDGWRGWMGRR